MQIVIDLLMYLLVGGLLAWLFYYYMRRELLGGFTGGLIVGVLGAILGAFLLNKIISAIIYHLQNGLLVSNVNIIAALLGSYVSVYIFNKINHDKRRD